MFSSSNMGVFISFEGIDGCGKSTQVDLLLKKFKTMDLNAVLIREPGGTSVSEIIRELLLKNQKINISPRTEALLMAASRAQLTREKIAPSLKDGFFVIADRYKDSTLAYQGGGRDLDLKILNKINNFASYDIDPDITFLIDIIPEEASLRCQSDGNDRIENEGLEFQRNVRKSYLKLSKQYSNRFIKINGKLTIEEIHRAIWKNLKNRIGYHEK